MSENTPGGRPFLWLIDSEQAQFDACKDAFAPWADCLRFAWNEPPPDRDTPPDAVFFSAEIPGGANGVFFAGLLESAGTVPLIAVARLRSLAQAVAYFRAGAADYLSLPLAEEDAHARFTACMERAAKPAAPTAPNAPEEEDILAQVPPPAPPPPPRPRGQSAPMPGQAFINDMPLPIGIPEEEEKEEESEEIPDNLLFADLEEKEEAPGDEPTPVDGLPVPALWEELPCGLLLFDSLGNLVFSNRIGLELLGRESLADLQDALEGNPASFAAHGLNHRPLPDNQWPHVLAARTRTPRSAVVSVETGDRRRAWLRIDCQPHLADGKIARLSMTVVNLTGELPPLQTQDAEKTPPPAAPRKSKKDRAKQRGRKKG